MPHDPSEQSPKSSRRLPLPENLNFALANSRHCKGKRVKAEIMTKVAAHGWSGAKLQPDIHAGWTPVFAVAHPFACAREFRPKPIPRIGSCSRAPLRLRSGVSTQTDPRSEEHTSELQSLMRISYAVFCLKKKYTTKTQH